MALDLDAFPAKVKLKQITVGKGFGSTDTLAQANQTLDAHGKYADDVAEDGFIAVDATRLAEARDGLIAAGVGRETVKGGESTRILLEHFRHARPLMPKMRSTPPPRCTHPPETALSEISDVRTLDGGQRLGLMCSESDS